VIRGVAPRLNAILARCQLAQSCRGLSECIRYVPPAEPASERGCRRSRPASAGPRRCLDWRAL